MTPRVFVVVTILFVAALVALSQLGPTGDDGPRALDGPAPAETRAGAKRLRQLRRKRTDDPQPVGDPPDVPDPREVTVAVWLGRWTNPSHQVFEARRFTPGSFFPLADEAPFPRDDITDDFLSMIHLAAVGSKAGMLRLADDVVDVHGTDDLLDDPWQALLVLEALRTRAELGGAQARSGDSPERVGEQAEAKATAPVLDLALDLLDAWPDHVIADYARVYAMHVRADRFSAVRDPEALADLATEVLRSTGDPLVIEAAIQQLARAAEEVPLAPDTLGLLLTLYDDPDLDLPRRPLAVMGATASLRAGRHAMAASWIARLHDVTATQCVEPHPVLREACLVAEEEVDMMAGWLAARETVSVPTWTAALDRAVRRCHLDGVAVPVPVEARGEVAPDAVAFDNWWPEAPELAGCLATAGRLVPGPERTVRVRLRVFPPVE